MGAPTAKHDLRFSLPAGRRPHMGWLDAEAAGKGFDCTYLQKTG